MVKYAMKEVPMLSILGIDIGKDQLVVVLLHGQQTAEPATFDNSPDGFRKLQRFLKKRRVQRLHACMEATGRYYEALADFLSAQGWTVSVVNPARIKAYADSQLSRNKTDQLDAALIADFCRTQQPPPWTPPPPQWRHLQALVRHLEDLQADFQRARNRQQALQAAAQPSPLVLDNLAAQLTLLQQQIEQVKRAIQQHINQHPDLKRDRDLLASIPGIGDLTAGKLLAEFRAIHDFSDVRQLVAFAGLNPRQHQSGKTARGHTPISKQGRATLRAALFLPAIVAKNRYPYFQPLIERWRQRGLAEMEIVVAIMRKLLHLIYGILKSGQPFDPHYLDFPAAIS
jgi:transposase